MGNSTWSAQSYVTYSDRVAHVNREALFSKKSVDLRFDPKKITFRESRDSEANPNSTAIILGLDVTGSMGMIAEHIAKKGLGTLVQGILDTKPVTDPHVCVMAIGDLQCDNYPLQVTQFEADIRIAEQLTDLYLEGGGGGNGSESYHLPWYFAGYKTSIDCFEKRNKKGYLFTFGDEGVPPPIEQGRVLAKINAKIERSLSAQELYQVASEKYNTFHIIVEQGDFCRRAKASVLDQWRKLIGHRAILLSDYTHLSEVVLAVMRVSEGEDAEEVVKSFEIPQVRDVVRHALFD